MRGRRSGVVGGACVGLALMTAATTVTAAPSGGALPPVLIQVLRIGGAHRIPGDASMVALNVTAVAPADNGYLTVYPCGHDVPLASNVNYLAGDVAPNMVLSRLAADGTVCIATLATTDVIVDLIGYVPSGSPIVPVSTPERALDTRTQSAIASPVPAGSAFSYELGGQYGVDATADAVLFNVTAIAKESPGFVTVWPCDADRPDTSTVNYGAFEVSPNFVISRLAGDGTLCFFTSAAADIIVDVAGHATGGFEMLARPERIHDSRLSGGTRPAGSTVRLGVTARADVPDDATAAIYNLTAVDAAAPGFATSHPCDVTAPVVSNLNYLPGGAVANTTVTKLSAAGELCVFNLTATNLIVDLVGYVRGTARYVPVTPARILDTREGWQRTCPWVVALVPVTFSTSQVSVTNAETGDTFTRPAFSTGVQRDTDGFVDADCSGYWYVDRIVPERLVFVPFPGFATKPPLPAAGAGSGGYRGYGQLADGTIVGVDGAANVVRLTDGAVLADLPVTEFVMQADVSANGVVALRLGAIQTSTITDPAHIEVWDMQTVERITDIPVDRDTVAMDISRSGAYLTLDRYVWQTGSTSTVVTFGGDTVDVAGRSGHGIVRSHFWGDGSLLVCAEGIGVFNWDLFSDPTLIADAFDPRFFGPPIPGSNAVRCDDVWV